MVALPTSPCSPSQPWRVSPASITVSGAVRGGSAVRVANEDPGIPDDRKESVCRMGEKGANSGGSGIVLYLVQTLVGQYGGTGLIEDNQPRGTVFVVEPLADE